MTSNGGWRSRRRWFLLALAATTVPGLAGCDAVKRSAAGNLPPAYTSNQITDPALLAIADEIRAWGTKQTGIDDKPLYGRVEVLRPVPIVQPYGVGVFQQEPRLPVILTTGPGWSGLGHEAKEAAVAGAFGHFSDALKALKAETPLRPTLTVQTPQGMALTWINRLDPNGKNIHGDD